jgi:hypothetical protein
MAVPNASAGKHTIVEMDNVSRPTVYRALRVPSQDSAVTSIGSQT